jgi:dolichol-phosphate mannosyltransferase
MSSSIDEVLAPIETGRVLGPAFPVPLVFVVPAYNEELNLPYLLAELEARPEFFGPGSALIIVDDGSSDGTLRLLEEYDGPLPLVPVPLGVNQGPGAAFRAGFVAALDRCPPERGALIVTLEADTTSNLDTLPRMIAEATGAYDLVLASVHAGGRMENVGPLRTLLSKGAGLVVRMALRVDAMTVSSFFRVYRASLLDRAFAIYGESLIREPGFACKAELLAKLSAIGARVVEVPTDLDASKRRDESKMRIAPTVFGYFRLLIRQRVSKQPASV